ncbi:MAG: FlgD immunoglobulin-like domain containing protein [Gemmatimonadota bacterium]
MSHPRSRRWIGPAILLSAVLLSPGPVRSQTAIPTGTDFRLEQNFPNPFTPGVSPTIFTYQLDAEENVRLIVYNLLAQEVAVLVDERQGAGLHRVAWDGLDRNDEPVPAGVYWYKLEAGERTALKRLRVRTSSVIEERAP